MQKFERMSIGPWRQFSSVNVDLSKQVTMLTGQNGCGKTTILTLLSRHFGWNLNFVSTPYMSKRTARRIWADIFDNVIDDIDAIEKELTTIGTITYDNGQECQLKVNALTGPQYQPEYVNMQNVEGMHIPSHRAVAAYTKVENIPTEPLMASQQYQEYQQLMVQYYGGARSNNPGLIQKRSIISLAVFGEGNTNVASNSELKRMYRGFQNILRDVLPDSIGFQRLDIRLPEVVLVTKTGDFSLDAMSGGVNAIFSIAWQIYMYGYGKENFVVTIDEPENHLHPSLQRTFIPKLAKAFPRCNIIAATHSPFIVSSHEDANVVALMRDADNKIVSQMLDLKDISGTPNEVLREILDVRSNLPVWVETEISKIVRNAQRIVPERRASYVMDRLKNLGIADAIVEYGRR